MNNVSTINAFVVVTPSPSPGTNAHPVTIAAIHTATKAPRICATQYIILSFMLIFPLSINPSVTAGL